MRRLREASIGLRLLAAFLVLLGTSSTAFSAIVCAAGACGEACPQQQKDHHTVQKKSCCPEEAGKSAKAPSDKEGDCCCSITSGPQVPSDTSKLAIPLFQIQLILPAQVIGPKAATVYAETEVISFYTDGSPPIVHARPDSNRAPPVA